MMYPIGMQIGTSFRLILIIKFYAGDGGENEMKYVILFCYSMKETT